jgi:hypothetical protein
MDNNKFINKYVYVQLFVILEILGLVLLKHIDLLVVPKQALLIYFLLGCICIVAFYIEKKRFNMVLLSDFTVIIWSGFRAYTNLNYMTDEGCSISITMLNIVNAVNLLISIVFFWIIYLIVRRVKIAVLIGNIVYGIWGTVNFYLVRFRGIPLQLTDFNSFGTAVSVAGNYNYVPNIVALMVWLDTIVWVVLIWNIYKDEAKVSIIQVKNYVIMAAFVIILYIKYNELDVWEITNDEYCISFLSNVVSMAQKQLPDEYNTDIVEEIINNYEENDFQMGG